MLFLTNRVRFSKFQQGQSCVAEHLYPILVQLKNGCSLKFLFDKNIVTNDLESCLTKFFSIIHEHYENFPNDALEHV